MQPDRLVPRNKFRAPARKGSPACLGENVRMRLGAFTLIELILVMAMLTVVLSLTWPSLAPFFRGRHLDSEAKRFLALTRYGQSRAASEGTPMILWIEHEEGAYGLRAESSYLEEDEREVEYELEKTITVEAEAPPAGSLSRLPGRLNQPVRGRSEIRFLPEGYMLESNPEWIAFRQSEADQILIGLSRNRLYYEIQTNSSFR